MITDEQIRELLTRINAYDITDATEIRRAFNAIGAKGRRSPHWYRRRRWARERCAELLAAWTVGRAASKDETK